MQPAQWPGPGRTAGAAREVRRLHYYRVNDIGLIVKLREREGQEVDSGSRLSIIDCWLSISISLMLYIKFGCHHHHHHPEVS